MGLRFRRRFRILPGVRLNLSRSGVSTSIGRRGFWVSYGRRGRRTTLSLPGSGLSYSTTSRAPGAVPARPGGGAALPFWLLLLAIAVLAWRANS
jgi:hypothetical protein